jgi:hypothetical protein
MRATKELISFVEKDKMGGDDKRMKDFYLI